jgi:putative ABC transport system permease protein
MSPFESVLIALNGLLANKLRSLLTMLGIIIGVASVIAMMAIGEGAARATQDQIALMGTNVLIVFPGSQRGGRISFGMGSANTLKMDDVEAIEKECSAVAQVAPEVNRALQIKFQNQNTRTTVRGTTPNFPEIRNYKIKEGRFLTKDDVERRAKVAILGPETAETLFGALQPVGKRIKVGGQSFTVVGVFKPKGAQGWQNPDDQVYVPVSTALRRLFGQDNLGSLSVQARSPTVMDQAQKQLEDLFRRRHKLGPNEDLDVVVRNQAEISETASALAKTMSTLLAGIASVSLLVGGIGIMNIMLVSVTERTKEIGLRKAIGAKRKDVLLQFLIESVTVSLVGGLIGVGVGIGTAVVLPKEDWPTVLKPEFIVMSFGFAAAIGIFFGLYPAVKASRLNPIDALRYE